MIDFNKALAFHDSALRGLAARQRVTAHNIANQSTANFRSSQVRFEETLGQAMQRGRPLDSVRVPRGEGRNSAGEDERQRRRPRARVGRDGI